MRRFTGTAQNPASLSGHREAELPVTVVLGAYCVPGALEPASGRAPALLLWVRPTSEEGGAAIMAKAGNRVKITLRCSECKQRNYNTNKNKRNTTQKLELNKYCPFCRKHTLHTETK